MDAPTSLPLQLALPRPSRGGSARVQLGSSELILEAVRGGHSLLWSNGRTAKRYVLGLARDGQLALQLRAPALPLRIAPREPVTLVPGARAAGYVHVSLVPTLAWIDAAGGVQTLLALHPDDLAAEWDDASGHTLHGSSPWYARFPMRSGEPRAIVPGRLANVTAEPWSPAHLELELRDAELRPLRGSIVAAPRRLRCTAAGVDASTRTPSRASSRAIAPVGAA